MPSDLKKPSLVDQESEGEPATILGADHVMCEVLLEFFTQETPFPGPSASFSPLKSTAEMSL
jgi:hypothetical protein